MIAFDFDWSEPLNLLLIFFVFCLGGIQIWLLKRSYSKETSSRKTAVRAVLNLLLWMVTITFVLQPVWKSSVLSGQVMIAGDDVPSGALRAIKDSLHINRVFSESDFKEKYFDTLTLAGQDFSPSFFGKLSRSLPNAAVVRWVSYSAGNQIQSISWKGIIRKGQMQRITGTVNSEGTQWAKIKFGGQTLDSVRLEKGIWPFVLSFPVFTEGRTKMELHLGDNPAEMIRFFARPLPSLSFQFILDNPDFESRNLAAWLGNHGHSVEISTSLSKNIRSKLTINKAADPDIIVTDPSNASNSLVKKAMSNGKSILFINLSNGSSDVAKINSAAGTKLQLKKISNEESLPVVGELSKLPFEFSASNAYLTIPGYPVAVEKTTGKVAVSLLNETFPTLLNGDSVLYSNIWTSVLAAIHPAYESNIEVSAPVFKNVKADFKVNNLKDNPTFFLVDKDTISLHYSTINQQSAVGEFMPSRAEWLDLPYDSQLYVENSSGFKDYCKRVAVNCFVTNRLHWQAALDDLAKFSDSRNEQVNEKRISDLVWFLAFMICFTALWLEPKFS